jgi:signal transduction histidine kinase
MTQVIGMRGDLDAPPDRVRDAIAIGVGMARDSVDAVATLITRIEDGGPSDRTTGLLAHLVTELLLDAASAFTGGGIAGNVVVVSTQRIGRFVVVRVADNAPGLPRHGLCLAGVVERIGGELRVETSPGAGAAVTVLVPVASE